MSHDRLAQVLDAADRDPDEPQDLEGDDGFEAAWSAMLATREVAA